MFSETHRATEAFNLQNSIKRIILCSTEREGERETERERQRETQRERQRERNRRIQRGRVRISIVLH